LRFVDETKQSFASGLIADGCDVATVQQALGHKLPSITLGAGLHQMLSSVPCPVLG